MSGPGAVVAAPVPDETSKKGPDMANRTCTVDGCTNPHDARGYCSHHYGQWRRHGDPTVMVRTPNGEALAWLEQTVQVGGKTCVEFPYQRNNHGYGSIYFDGRERLAHQVALILSGSPRPAAPNDCALHSCDKRLCVNPAHLRWGTKADNSADMLARGRSSRGEGRWNHKLSTEDVTEIRSRDYSRRGSMAATAREYGVWPSAISRVLAGQRWTHV